VESLSIPKEWLSAIAKNDYLEGKIDSSEAVARIKARHASNFER
jgi:hypothetical protein